MIEEIDSAQYVKHYFDKVYKELDYSPESFMRAALEYVEQEAGLLSQPGAMESLQRLADGIANQEGVSPSAPSTAPIFQPSHMEPSSNPSTGISAPEGARQPTPASTDMPDVSTAVADGDEAESKHGLRK